MFRKQADILIDSGAEVSLISKDFVEDIQKTQERMLERPSDIPAIQTLANHKIEVQSQIDAELEMCGQMFNWKVYVIPHLDDKVVLGQEFLKAKKAVVDFETDTITIPAHKETMQPNQTKEQTTPQPRLKLRMRTDSRERKKMLRPV